MAIPSNFASLMTPVLARLLNCSGVEEMKVQRGHLFQEYFQEFQVRTERNVVKKILREEV